MHIHSRSRLWWLPRATASSDRGGGCGEGKKLRAAGVQGSARGAVACARRGAAAAGCRARAPRVGRHCAVRHRVSGFAAAVAAADRPPVGRVRLGAVATGVGRRPTPPNRFDERLAVGRAGRARAAAVSGIEAATVLQERVRPALRFGGRCGSRQNPATRT